MTKRKTSKSKRNTARTKPKAPKPQKTKPSAPKREALWKTLAREEGAYTPEEMLKWKAEAVKRYQELTANKGTNETPLSRYKRQRLGYALRIHHNKPKPPKETPEEKESVLKNYKKYLQESKIPSIQQVGWERFLKALERLPAELQAEFTGKIKALINQWGEEAVMQYMDNIGILDEDFVDGTYNPYLIVLVAAYLYRLEMALLVAESGIIPSSQDSDSHDEVISLIEKSFKNPDVKNRLYELISDGRIIDEAESSGLTEYFDEQWEDF